MRRLRDQKFDKTYRNVPEQMFAEWARSEGWSVTKCGYPDFICYKNGDIMLVEVKMKKTHRLKKSQSNFMNAMSARGVKCYKWSPDKPFGSK